MIDYEFYLAGQTDKIKRLFNARPEIRLALLDSRNSIIMQFKVNQHKLVINGDGIIMLKDSLKLPAEKYRSMKDWNVEIRFPKAALQPAQPALDTVIQTQQSIPPLAPNVVHYPVSGAEQLPEQTSSFSNRLARLEQVTFGTINQSLPVQTRIEQLEMTVHRATASTQPLAERLQNLERTLLGSTD